jgi:hypothetical protein
MRPTTRAASHRIFGGLATRTVGVNELVLWRTHKRHEGRPTATAISPQLVNPRCFFVGAVVAVATASVTGSVASGAGPELISQRQQCRELKASGDRKRALAACHSIVARGGSAEDFRLAVAALVDMADDPTPEQWLEANTLAGAAVRVSPEQPWGYAARCDIARRWQDPQMVASCLADLRRVAPQHPETARALALGHPRARIALLAGWLLLIGAVTITVIRRYRVSRAERKPGHTTVASAVTVGLLAVAFLASAPAQAAPPKAAPRAAPPPPADDVLVPGLPPIDDANPASSVPSPQQRDAEPLKFGYFLQELIDRAQRATLAGDHQKAARYYVAIAKAVPDRATGFGKLCEALEAAGMRERALTSCGQALAREGVRVEDFVRFVRLTLAKPGALTEAEVKEADSAVKHLTAQPGAALTGHHLACELATRLEGTDRLERCTAALVAAAPQDPKTVYFQWALAVRRKDRDQARTLVERARATGMGEAGVTKMRQATDELSPGGWLGLRYWKTGLLLLLLVIGMTVTLTRARATRSAPTA